MTGAGGGEREDGVVMETQKRGELRVWQGRHGNNRQVFGVFFFFSIIFRFFLQLEKVSPDDVSGGFRGFQGCSDRSRSQGVREISKKKERRTHYDLEIAFLWW